MQARKLNKAGQGDRRRSAAPPRLDDPLRILGALRRIVRAFDIHSRRLLRDHEVTVPQMRCLLVIESEGVIGCSDLARAVDLNFSTVNGILDRLEQRGLVERRRLESDRRKVQVTVTRAGRRLVVAAPQLLQDRVVDALLQLSARERSALSQSLERIVGLMDAQCLNASGAVSVGSAGSSVQGRRGAKRVKGVARDYAPST